MMNMRKEKGRKSFNYQEPFLDHILTMIMVVFPLNGSPVFFFLASTVFIGCGGEKMIGIQKMPSLVLMGY